MTTDNTGFGGRHRVRPSIDHDHDHDHDHDALGDRPPSWQSRLITALLRRLPIKRKTATAEAVRDFVRRQTAHPAPHKPAGLGAKVAVGLRSFSTWPVYRTTPMARPATANLVVFLHGGGYVKEIVKAHWRFIGFLTRETGASCLVPIYPLAPQGTALDVVPTIGRLLAAVIDEADGARVTVIGNSAGGGMALAAAQWLRDNGHRQPDSLVLISPGLDATLSHRHQGALAATDPTQDIPGIREGARMYAGELALSHPYVSPLKGELHGLAPMLVFAGTADLLHPDSVALASLARAAGGRVELHLRRGQPHNYAGLPTPEGREDRERILRAVSEAF